MGLKSFTSVKDIRDYSRHTRKSGKTLALVPTMGALHDGHLSLIRMACQKADEVVVSIFVNPIQFGPGEDLDKYPRQLDKDKRLAEQSGAQAIYSPTLEEMYPNNFTTNIHVKRVTDGLCGASRPGHFDGVATVVAKLLHQVEPDIAVFGEKDYQQLCVIKTMVRDLDIDCEILGAPIIRDSYGLALSSRNAYLSPSQIDVARKLNVILKKISQKIEKTKDLSITLSEAEQELLESGFDAVDYIELRQEDTLENIASANVPSRLLAAVHIGPARLIDNVQVNQE